MYRITRYLLEKNGAIQLIWLYCDERRRLVLIAHTIGQEPTTSAESRIRTNTLLAVRSHRTHDKLIKVVQIALAEYCCIDELAGVYRDAAGLRGQREEFDSARRRAIQPLEAERARCAHE
jgi:hypothetical protein